MCPGGWKGSWGEFSPCSALTLALQNSSILVVPLRGGPSPVVSLWVSFTCVFLTPWRASCAVCQQRGKVFLGEVWSCNVGTQFGFVFAFLEKLQWSSFLWVTLEASCIAWAHGIPTRDTPKEFFFLNSSQLMRDCCCKDSLRTHSKRIWFCQTTWNGWDRDMNISKGGVRISFSQWPVRDPERVTGQGQSTEFTAGAAWEWRGSPGLWEDFFNEFFLKLSKANLYTDMTGLLQSLCAFPKLLVSFGSSPKSAERNKGVVFLGLCCPGLWLMQQGWLCCEKWGCEHCTCDFTFLQGLCRRAGITGEISEFFYNRIYIRNINLHCCTLLWRISCLVSARYKIKFIIISCCC